MQQFKQATNSSGTIQEKTPNTIQRKKPNLLKKKSLKITKKTSDLTTAIGKIVLHHHLFKSNQPLFSTNSRSSSSPQQEQQNLRLGQKKGEKDQNSIKDWKSSRN